MRRRDKKSRLRKRHRELSDKGNKSSLYSFSVTIVFIVAFVVVYKFPHLVPKLTSIIAPSAFEGSKENVSSPSSFYTDKSVAETSALFKSTGRENATMVFATWCAACRSDMPNFIEASKTSSAQFIAISIDKDSQRLEQYIKSMPPNNIKWVKVPFPCPGFPCEQLEYEFNNIDIDYYGGVPHYTILDRFGTAIYSNTTIMQVGCYTGGAC